MAPTTEFLSKISEVQDAAFFNDLWEKLILNYPENLQLYMAKLKYLDESPNRQENLAEIVVAANDVLSRISEDDLSKCLGRKVDLENGAAVEVRTRDLMINLNNMFVHFKLTICFKHFLQASKCKMIEKDYLIKALARLASAIADSDTAEESTFTDIIRRLNSWIDLDSTPNLMTLLFEKEMRTGMYGLALKCINVILDDEQECKLRPISRSTLLAKRASIFKTLGFDSLIENEIRVRTISCPKSFSLF